MEPNTWENIEDQFTIDGKVITPGLKVVNYNMDDDVVIEPMPYGNPAEAIWFRTEKGMFDGSRMWVARPPRMW